MTLGRSCVSGGKLMTVAVVGLMMVAAGCSTVCLQGNDLPRGAKVVGGGFMINWEAPTAGTAYLVEKTSGKIVETKSLGEDDSYDFEMSLDDEEVVKMFENAFGVPIEKAKLVLYFRPAPPEVQEQ